LPTNPIATGKLCAVRSRGEEAIAKSWPDEQEADIKAWQADELAKSSEVQKATVTLLRKSDG